MHTVKRFDRSTRNTDLVKSAKPKLLVASSYFPPAVGGLERYAFEMAKIAQHANYDVAVICSGKGSAIQKDNNDGIAIYRLPTQFTLKNTPVNLRWSKMIRQILLDEEPDIINVHMPVPYLCDLVILASKGIPSIVTYHSGSMKKHHLATDAPIELYERCVLPTVFRKASTIICPSKFVRDTFLKKYRSKSKVIPPGVDTSMFTRREVDPEENKIIFIGNFSYEWKGLRYLLDAIDLLPAAHLVVVGAGTPVEHARATYLGLLAGNELVREIQSSKVLVLPSISNAESFGMVLIEGMACGVAVVGADIGGIPNTICNEEDGLLVKPRSGASLAHAITRIIEDAPLEKRLTEKAYKKVVNDYTWHVQGPKYVAALEELRQSGRVEFKATG
jgi:glycosyltransferase involved in cell wall biosynthesis